MAAKLGVAARLSSRARAVLADRELVESAALRFLSRCVADETTGCLNFCGGRGDGYAQLKVGGALVMVHRFAFVLWHGSVDPALDVDHSCNNKRCVSAAHLEQVTHAENVARRDRHLGDWLIHDEHGRFASRAA